MTRYLLDTNIISNATKPVPSSSLLQWLGAQDDADLFISVFSLAEIKRGILQKPEGRKRRELSAWFSGPEGPPALFAGRILPFDERAALAWARLMAEGRAAGRAPSAIDMMIAAVASVNGCTVITDNEKDFRLSVAMFNPLRGDQR